MRLLSEKMAGVWSISVIFSLLVDWPLKGDLAMTVREIMKKNPVTIPYKATIHDAALKMKEEHVGAVLIVDDGVDLKGIVTDRDIAISVAADSMNPMKTCACDIMTKNPITVSSDTDIESALKVMCRENVRRLPVLDNGKLAGIVSSADLASELREEFDSFMGLEEAFARV
jgi:CBS domain-containing protein